MPSFVDSRWLWKPVLAVAVVALSTLGCETGKTSKAHPAWLKVSDVTTTAPADAHTPQSDKTAEAEAQNGEPLVPGSPTASNSDGTQPQRDEQARPSPSAEKGKAAAPREQPARRTE